MDTWLPYLSAILLLIAIIMFVISTRHRRRLGVPTGKVIYTDTSKWAKIEKSLFEPNIRLAGKPDYLVEQSGCIMPVEVKSGKAPQAPYDSHIFQLAAYCLLVQHAYGMRPNRGFIHYQKLTYAIDFTPALEQSVKDMILEMQSYSIRSEVNRSHEEPNRCRRCGYRSMCDQALRI